MSVVATSWRSVEICTLRKNTIDLLSCNAGNLSPQTTFSTVDVTVQLLQVFESLSHAEKYREYATQVRVRSTCLACKAYQLLVP